ncbi:hypothetical protein QQX98_001333 [Neonectria punicea]|uniref:PD-(D/E)XK nuclease-like domain-containing protein n=1 Tax=Neonectria punicea TaxID=979145 RepID=A0ABR1HP77_9HYPO
MSSEVIIAWLSEVSSPKRIAPPTDQSPRLHHLKRQRRQREPLGVLSNTLYNMSRRPLDGKTDGTLRSAGARSREIPPSPTRRITRSQRTTTNQSASLTDRTRGNRDVVATSGLEDGWVRSDDDNDDDDDDRAAGPECQTTPRPRKTHRSNYGSTLSRGSGQQLSNPPTLTSSQSHSQSSLSKRSSSPVKRVAALRDVGGGITFQDLGTNKEHLGEGGKRLFLKLRDIADKMGILPNAIMDEISAADPELCVRPFHLKEDTRSNNVLLAELKDIQAITRRSLRCDRDLEGEAEWNNAVHSKILRSALGESDEEGEDVERVGMRYVPNAKMDSRYVLPLTSGAIASSKMVDYVLFIGDNEDEDEDDSPQAKYSSTFARDIARIIVNSTDSINQTPYFSLRHRPIAVSIETKTISRTEEEARVQLAIWVAAQMHRIRELGRQYGAPITSVSTDVDDDAITAVDTILLQMTFPLLYVNSSHWTLLLARPSLRPSRDGSSGKQLQVTIYNRINLGDSSSLLGTYQLISSLRVLLEWIDIDFRLWWRQILNVLYKRR